MTEERMDVSSTPAPSEDEKELGPQQERVVSEEHWQQVPYRAPPPRPGIKNIRYQSEPQPSWEGKSYYQTEPQAEEWLALPPWEYLAHESGNTTQIGKRLMAALDERCRRGSFGYPKVIPQVRGKVDPAKLPYTTFTHKEQEEVIKAFAHADARCPIQGCETDGALHADLAPVGTRYLGKSDLRDKDGFLRGAFIRPGYGTRIDTPKTVRPRATEYLAHWLAFTMRVDLCCTLFCPIRSETKVPKASCKEVFYDWESLVKHHYD